MTTLGILRTYGYELRLTYHEADNGTKHFEIVALGMCLADAPFGEVRLSRDEVLYPALSSDADRLGFGLADENGAMLLRFLVEISAALDGGDVLSSEWDFEHDPASPLAHEPETAAVGA